MIFLFFYKNILHKNYTHPHILIKLNIHIFQVFKIISTPIFKIIY